MTKTIDERSQAMIITSSWLEDGDNFAKRDPDGDECIVARSYQRALEKITRLTKIVTAVEREGSDGTRTVLSEFSCEDLITELKDKWPEVNSSSAQERMMSQPIKPPIWSGQGG